MNKKIVLFIVVPTTVLVLFIACQPVKVRLPNPESIDKFLKDNGLDRKDILDSEVTATGKVILTIRSMAIDILETSLDAALANSSTGLVGLGSGVGTALVSLLIGRLRMRHRIKKGEIQVIKQDKSPT